ncbi:hypothetical protein [Nocardioides abyssi]|uniref:Sensor domain-containing protein n=1 Tax=Nocardioides abyssi TaxID=3058370 RepID=A0ABT8EWZ7_9ACTN|nr:hypothetical protein [Nocardioides abyssi]MDN4162396.1 hypothetical protein [Nocardioides abyssi]
MRDPIEDLQHFRTDGTTVNPLPASEVRRRGDRMRRRNTAVATVGGVAAALVAVGVPFGIAQSGGGDGPDTSPAPPSVSWLQEAPEGFPLDAGYAASATDEVAPAIPDVCGTPFWTTAGTTDVAGATLSGGEAFDARTLMVYPDDDAAERALAGIRAAVADCPEQTELDESPDTTLVHDVLDQDLPTEESFVFVQRARFDDGLLSDATITGIGRSGNALLVDQSYASPGDDRSVATNLRLQLQRAARPFSELCVFSATPCSPGDGSQEDPAAQVVPDGFPLLGGWPEESEGGEFGPAGPTRTGLDVMEPEACGATAPVPAHTDLVRAAYSNPEDYRQRQLLTFATTEEADAYVDAVLAIFDDCFEVETEDGTTRLTQRIDEVSGTGDRAGGAVTRYERDGDPVPGMSTLLVVRVGSAVLLGEDQSEGSGGLEPEVAVQESFQSILAEAEGVIRAMRDL